MSIADRVLALKPTLVFLLVVLVAHESAAAATTTRKNKCPDGLDFKRDRRDCTKYYQCLNGAVIQESFCPDGLYFNDQARVCDWPENVPECYLFQKKKSQKKKKPVSDHLTPEHDNTIASHSGSSSVAPWSEPPTLSTKASWDVEWSPSIGPTTAAEPLREALTDQYKIVCYFSNWAWYRPDAGRFIPEDINPYFCTHINYAFAVLDHEELTIKIHDSWADVDNRFLQRIVALKKKNPRLKVMLAIGGW